MTENMDNLAQSIAQINTPEFDDMLRSMTTFQIKWIEYGNPEKPGGSMSAIRIRWINPPGGEQFALKILQRGIEGSGVYFHVWKTDQLKQHLVQMLSAYHKPLSPKLQATLNTSYTSPFPKETLTFFACGDEETLENLNTNVGIFFGQKS